MNDSRKDTLTLWGAGFLLAIGLSLGGCCSAQLLERELDDMAFSRSLCKERAYIIHEGTSPNGVLYTLDAAAEIVYAIDKRLYAHAGSCDQVYHSLNGKIEVGLELEEIEKALREINPKLK